MNKKYFIPIVLAIILTVCFSACSPKDEGITVENVTFAESLDSNYQAVNPTTQFHPTDVIYVSVSVKGSPDTGTMTGQFYYYDQFISEASLDFATVNKSLIALIGQTTYVGFNLTPSTSWPVDSGYTFKLLVNDVEIGSYPYEVID